MNWASVCLGALCSLVGSRSNSASGVHCHQSLCCRLPTALTGPCQTQGQWDATGFPLWCDLQSLSTGKNRAFQKLLLCCAFETASTFEFLEKPARLSILLCSRAECTTGKQWEYSIGVEQTCRHAGRIPLEALKLSPSFDGSQTAILEHWKCRNMCNT